MKITDITQPGFYWNRLDEHREWTVVFVKRVAINSAHPKHNTFTVDASLMPVSGQAGNVAPSNNGEFEGPIRPPAS